MNCEKTEETELSFRGFRLTGVSWRSGYQSRLSPVRPEIKSWAPGSEICPAILI